MASCGVCQHVCMYICTCTIPVRAGKGRDKSGDEKFMYDDGYT